MDMMVDFPGGDRVDAHFGPYTVLTDQSNARRAWISPNPVLTISGIHRHLCWDLRARFLQATQPTYRWIAADPKGTQEPPDGDG